MAVGMVNQETDTLESRIRALDNTTKSSTGTSLFHLLALGSIGASIALYLSGKKDLAIFIGLWPPTFEALRPRQ
jgi:phosphotransferase system HPr-like phosphotransfer protein